MTTLAAPYTKDRATLGLGMAISAVFFGLAIKVNPLHVAYTPRALFWLTIGAGICLAAVVLRFSGWIEELLRGRFTAILAVIAFGAAAIVYRENRYDHLIAYPAMLLAILGLFLAASPRAMRIPLTLAMVLVFCAVATITITSLKLAKYPDIDVFLFQQAAADALAHGHNPYAIHVPNIYSGGNSTAFQDPVRFGPGTPFYGPGVVDDNGWITYGFPYPPLSLLMVMPAYLLSGDCRFADVVAMGISALLMYGARTGKWGALAALLFLVTSQGFYVISMSWSEPLLVLTFSLVMFCACRWRKGLPWALGLFFATKQYTVFAVPLLFLLLEGPNPFRELLKMLGKASLVVAAITLPFFVWNSHDFIRSVVQWQIVQPFRMDALSYLVWMFKHNGGQLAPIWTPLIAVIPAIIIGIGRCARSPAGFAAAVTLTYLTFFAFNKQAFCNYYYFVIGAACWSVAAMYPRTEAGSASESAAISSPARFDPILSGG